MKKLFFVLAFVFLSQSINAQLFTKEKIQNQANIDKMKYSWGYFLGFNDYDFNFDYNQDREDIQVQKNLGLQILKEKPIL